MSHFCVYVFHDGKKSVRELLEPFSEDIAVEPYVAFTRQEAIEYTRNFISKLKNSNYKEFLDNPDAYREKYKFNPNHLDFIENEFPKMLEFTDEECYEYEAKYYRQDGMIDSDGNLLTIYNPNSKWDWYVEGGRWSNILPRTTMLLNEIDIGNVKTPYAFVTPNGEWEDVDDFKTKEDWESRFREYLKSIYEKEGMNITQIDCHI